MSLIQSKIIILLFLFVTLNALASQDLVDAVKEYDVPKVRRLLNDPKENVNEVIDGYTALHWVLISNALNHRTYKLLTELLIQHGANVNAEGEDGSSPIHIAVATLQDQNIQILVENGAYVDQPDGNNLTALQIAKKIGYDRIAKILEKSTLRFSHRKAIQNQKAGILSSPESKLESKVTSPTQGDGEITADGWKTVNSVHHNSHPLQKLAEGKLGSNPYFIQLEMKPVHGTVLLLNLKLAVRLGLISEDDTQDPKKIEKLKNDIRNHFSYVVSSTNEATRSDSFSDAFKIDTTRPAVSMLATYYQDSITLRENSPKGEGRTVVVGHGRMMNEDGTFDEIDFGLKGIGRTSLQPQTLDYHSSGVQDIQESRNSYVNSLVNRADGLDTQEDLAVIAIPEVSINDGPATITVRALNNIRLAHFRWHYTQKIVENFAKMMEFGIRRTLKLDPQQTMTSKDVVKYIQEITRRLAIQSARLSDTYRRHLTPTPGNLSVSGQILDTGNMGNPDSDDKSETYGDFINELDERNKNYVKLFSDHAEKYFNILQKRESKTGIPVIYPKKLSLIESFNQQRIEESNLLRLSRIGFNQQDLVNMSQTCRKERNNFLSEVEKLVSSDEDQIGIDFRPVFKNSIKKLINYSEKSFPKSLDLTPLEVADAREIVATSYIKLLKRLIQCVDQKNKTQKAEIEAQRIHQADSFPNPIFDTQENLPLKTNRDHLDDILENSKMLEALAEKISQLPNRSSQLQLLDFPLESHRNQTGLELIATPNSDDAPEFSESDWE